MARVLITGANGHMGSNTVRNLLRDNHAVVPIVRHGADLRDIEKLNLNCVSGDLLDAVSLERAALGCEVIIHTATVYRNWDKNPDEIIQPAILGAKNIFQAAKQAGIRRMVYTSSPAAVDQGELPGFPIIFTKFEGYAINPPSLIYLLTRISPNPENLFLNFKIQPDSMILKPAM